jgi:hypothetical protein
MQCSVHIVFNKLTHQSENQLERLMRRKMDMHRVGKFFLHERKEENAKE